MGNSNLKNKNKFGIKNRNKKKNKKKNKNKIKEKEKKYTRKLSLMKRKSLNDVKSKNKKKNKNKKKFRSLTNMAQGFGNDKQLFDYGTNNLALGSDQFLQRILSHEQPQDSKKRIEFRILFLGCAEAGKSTIIKNLKNLSMTKFSNEEKIEFRDAIRDLIFNNIKNLLLGSKYQLQLEFSSSLEALFLEFNKIPPKEKLRNSHWNLIQKIWETDLIKQVYQKREEFSKSEYQITDSIEIFLDQISKIKQPEFLPNTKEIIHCYLPTKFIVLEELVFDNIVLRIHDLPGYRNGRKQWPSVYDDIQVICFVVALNEYDMSLRESKGENRLRDSLNEFSNICSSPWFSKTKIILIFNKTDLFKTKLQKKKLKSCFPEYNGDNSYQDAFEFIKSKFLHESIIGQYNKNRINIYLSNSTDINSVSTTFNCITNKIIDRDMEKNFNK
ncbi:g protein alpha i subunit [Anaeramoeba flamelloides]|uniref:G protein alpha i subunit n=1 Tax=Anaeramoeba flamelloides TaxID=1746091 RepID=A0AAV7YQG6_9EUKA|nr:g protein alpha i subunit [Anaeramoeba flamelloides]KAJ6238819.1 g protein alpha i subunit [Anaeramoeba flamelloides]